jgi:23S rRNA pseudouridine1911/1915/1917 synthase
VLEPQAMDLVVPYEDEHLLVVDKPAGLVVHPAPGHAQGTLVHGLLAYDVEGGDEPERPGIVHRLDRDTSGLLVVARSPEAHRRLQVLVQSRGLTREYLALVAGRPRSRRGTVDAPLGRDRHDPLRQSSTPTHRATQSHTSRSKAPATARTATRHARHRANTPDPVCISPRSTCRYRATRFTAEPATSGSSGSSSMRRGSRSNIRSQEMIDVVSPLPPDLEACLERAS